MPKPSANSAHYAISVLPDSHELRCCLRLTGRAARGPVRLEIPTWVPGDYSFFLLARDVFEVAASDTSTGAPLELVRDGWQAFHVRGGTGDITVNWRAYAYEPDFAEPCGIVDGEWAILLGGRYLHCPRWLGECTVQYEIPDVWRGTLHHPSGAKRIGADTWRYPSFEILLDTPVCMGATSLKRRDVGGTPFYFLFVDQGVGFDAEVDGFCDKVTEVARGFSDVFGGFPFEDYTFVLTLNPIAEWGLEHLTSSMCGLGPDVFTDPNLYATGIRVCAHELFHAWNVRRLRPAPLGVLARQLTSGSFTEGLWLAEGFTRYYEFLSCTRAGVYSLDQFLSAVVGYYEHLTVLPAYERVAVTDSSLSTYLKHDPKYPGRCNNYIDYYDKGMLIAFCLDARLRLSNDSLDAAFAAFYSAREGYGPKQPGYTTEEAVSWFEGRQPGLGDILEKQLVEPGSLDTLELLGKLGFEIQHELRWRAGLMFLDDSQPTIYNVLDESPAGRAGIAPGDVVSQVNGYKYSWAALTWACGRASPVTLSVYRGHRSLSFTLSPMEENTIRQLVWRGNRRQAAMIREWLGPATDLSACQVFSLDFYENFHGIETVI